MFSIFRDTDHLDTVEQQLVEMLGTCQDTFRLATAALFGEEDVWEAGAQLDQTDKDLNRTERAIRRELLVHGTVRGAETDLGLMLAYMSVAKDIERIGDYCKNIWNLAQIGVSFAEADDIEELSRHRRRVASLLSEAVTVFADQDAQAVHGLIPSIRDDLGHYDSHIVQFVSSELPGRYAAPRALFYRYLKRISAHLSNTLSSVVMPVDRLDFYKPSKAVVEPIEVEDELEHEFWGVLRLGIDLDGVVADFTQGWISFYNRDFGTDLKVEDSRRWNDVVELTHFEHIGEFWKWSSDLDGRSVFWHLEPFPGAVEALHELSAEGHEIVIITTKPRFAHGDTYEWIERHRVPADEVHILEDKWLVPADVYLDDGPHILPLLLEHRPEATVCRYVRPWNRPVTGAVDVRDFDEFREVVSRLAAV